MLGKFHENFPSIIITYPPPESIGINRLLCWIFYHGTGLPAGPYCQKPAFSVSE